MPEEQIPNELLKQYKAKGRTVDRPRKRWTDEAETGYETNPQRKRKKNVFPIPSPFKYV
jgi:hypothetical protein